jgi:hypothetical protein
MTPISRGFGGRRRDDVDPVAAPAGSLLRAWLPGSCRPGRRRATIDQQTEIAINRYAIRWTDATGKPTVSRREMTRLQPSNTRTRAKQVTYVQSITDVDDKIIRRTREEHRRNRRFADADRIRDQLAAHGVILEDSPTRVRWRPSTR